MTAIKLSAMLLLVARCAFAELALVSVSVETNRISPTVRNWLANNAYFITATGAVGHAYVYEQPYCREMADRLNEQVAELRRTVSDLTYPKVTSQTLYVWSNVTYRIYAGFGSAFFDGDPIAAFTNSTCFRRIEMETRIEQAITTNTTVQEIDL